MTINLKIKNERKKQGCTQDKLANRLGLSVRTYRKYENGEIDFTINQLEKIGVCLKMDILSLITNELECVYVADGNSNYNSLVKINSMSTKISSNFDELKLKLEETLEKIDHIEKQLSILYNDKTIDLKISKILA